MNHRRHSIDLQQLDKSQQQRPHEHRSIWYSCGCSLGFLSSMWTWYWISIHHRRTATLTAASFVTVRFSRFKSSDIWSWDVPRRQGRQNAEMLMMMMMMIHEAPPMLQKQSLLRCKTMPRQLSECVGILTGTFYQKCNPMKAQTGSEQLEDLYRIHSDENNI